MRSRQLLVAGLSSAFLPGFSSPAADTVTVNADSVAEYVLGCRKPNGAFGPIDQHYTDAAWNFPAVAALKLLGVKIERPEAILENGLGYPEGHVGYGHWQFFHYHKIRELLRSPVTPENDGFGWRTSGRRKCSITAAPSERMVRPFSRPGAERIPIRGTSGRRSSGFTISRHSTICSRD